MSTFQHFTRLSNKNKSRAKHNCCKNTHASKQWHQIISSKALSFFLFFTILGIVWTATCLHSASYTHTQFTLPHTLHTFSDTHMLKIQQYKCKTRGFCTFSCFGPHIWNSLPQDLRHCSILSFFKAKLKNLPLLFLPQLIPIPSFCYSHCVCVCAQVHACACIQISVMHVWIHCSFVCVCVFI